MTFWEYVGHGFKVCLFDKQAVQDIITDPQHKRNSLILAVILAALVTVVFAAMYSLLAYFVPQALPLKIAQSWYIPAVVLVFVTALLFSLMSAGLMFLIARSLGGTATIFQYYSASLASAIWLGIASGLLTPIQIIPLIGSLVNLAFSIYGIIVGIFVIREAFKLSTGRAVGTFAIVWAIFCALLIAVMIVGFIAYYHTAAPVI